MEKKQPADSFADGLVAESEGFEPPVQLPTQLISSQSRSTTLAALRCKYPKNSGCKNETKKNCLRYRAFDAGLPDFGFDHAGN